MIITEVIVDLIFKSKTIYEKNIQDVILWKYMCVG